MRTSRLRVSGRSRTRWNPTFLQRFLPDGANDGPTRRPLSVRPRGLQSQIEGAVHRELLPLPPRTAEGGTAAFFLIENPGTRLSQSPREKPAAAHRRLDNASSLDDPNEQNDDRDDQENVDESADRVTGDQTQQPKHQQDYEDRPKHALLLSPHTALWPHVGEERKACHSPRGTNGARREDYLRA